MTRKTVSKFVGRWGAVCGLLLGGILFNGCQSSPSEATFAPTSAPAGGSAVGAGGTASMGTDGTAAPAPLGKPDNIDSLRVGDTLRITFADLPILLPPEEQRIKDDGSITLMQNETFQAAGKTRGSLEKEVRERYVPQYFRNMTVSISQKNETQFYFVNGEVRLPNRQVFISRTTVLKAIASAGGFTDFAKKTKIKLTRVDGRIFIINGKKALVDPRLDLEVFPGDKIDVPRSIW